MSEQSNVGRWRVFGNKVMGSLDGGDGEEPLWPIDVQVPAEHGDAFTAERFVPIESTGYVSYARVGGSMVTEFVDAKDETPNYRREVVTRTFTVCQHCTNGMVDLPNPDPANLGDDAYALCPECDGDYQRWETT